MIAIMTGVMSSCGRCSECLKSYDLAMDRVLCQILRSSGRMGRFSSESKKLASPGFNEYRGCLVFCEYVGKFIYRKNRSYSWQWK